MLELKNINKTFLAGSIDEKKLFYNFSLLVKKGEFVSVVGSNGSGKTTILNIISGDMPIDKGSVIFDGEDITNVCNYHRARRIARVFQDPSVGTCPTMTIYENLSLADNKGKKYNLGKGLNTKRKEFYQTSLETLGMGLENRLDSKAGVLSGGQRQALSLVMATMSSPDLLLLDEHTAALDPRSADIVMHLTDRIVKEKNLTAIMVTHNLRYAVDYGNRAIMLHDGNVILDVCGKEKTEKSIVDYLSLFNSISIECGN